MRDICFSSSLAIWVCRLSVDALSRLLWCVFNDHDMLRLLVCPSYAPVQSSLYLLLSLMYFCIRHVLMRKVCFSSSLPWSEYVGFQYMRFINCCSLFDAHGYIMLQEIACSLAPIYSLYIPRFSPEYVSSIIESLIILRDVRSSIFWYTVVALDVFLFIRACMCCHVLWLDHCKLHHHQRKKKKKGQNPSILATYSNKISNFLFHCTMPIPTSKK